MILLQIVRI